MLLRVLKCGVLALLTTVGLLIVFVLLPMLFRVTWVTHASRDQSGFGVVAWGAGPVSLPVLVVVFLLAFWFYWRRG
jgi:hypothetical protein